MKTKVMIVSSFFVSAVQAATLIPSTGIEVLFINGVKNEEKREIVNVEATTVQLLLRYNEKVGTGNSKKVFDSAPYVVTFNVNESDITIKAPKVYSYEQARLEFKSNPMWAITNSEGSVVSYTQAKLPPEEGFMPYYDLETMLTKYNKAQNVSFAVGESDVNQVNSTKLKDGKIIPSLEQLKKDYLLINKTDRKAFQKWIIDQD
ncbi:DUF2057 family protein [Aliivibrio sp. S4TY2]|uniref:DUF2057 family protein n=1 Tax=unclassified Aliivibrio TaxID=2645654 RepID=UPI00237846C8|nr:MULTISPECIES: DUF2057 family protein [unclassified Aliivibrio]MDD9157491.1 DUF2057 family protein [Aliivibrio sp. S4TY2]MDD9161315.1 DUF2057 family protein [Aliivibrio sp. S4TY1]MDD9165345.1 DUF2057 family protein [Aliivibrio sp. S4MY2]MDD9169400.1 DUF2057 family protein [Aliivibrio sp. S4MY4]MDD9186393.1 DUF2057 family protein [Aliivibrio sp. S4MY3]